MKVKKLCIASIFEIEKIEEVGAGVYYAKTVETGNSVFYQMDESKVKEVKTGIEYPTSIQTGEKINYEFVKNLDFEAIDKRLKEVNYQKEEIRKRKVLKLLKDKWR